MENLYNFILENFDNSLKLSNEDKTRLIELDNKFNELADIYEKEHIHYANITNMDEAIDSVLTAVKNNDKKFKLHLDYEKSNIENDKWCEDFIDKINKLKIDFIDLNCYLTKFYIYRINKIIEQIMFLNHYTKDNKILTKVKNYPSLRLYKEAVKLIKDNPYIDKNELIKKDKDYKQTYTPEESQKILQKEIDKYGYGWKVVIDKNMVPRMSVRPYREFRINANNNFSKVDLESLKVHEVAVHVARKYNALQSGLYLFIHGLKGNNVYDEGLAIYNSLNKVDKPKPNILFYICMKIILLYHMHTSNIINAFNHIKKLTGIDDRKIALAIVRASRIYIYTPLGNYSTDEDYLDGYLRVKDMSEEDRKKLLEIPIGPDQLFEIDTLKKFINVNKFDPIKTDNDNE